MAERRPTPAQDAAIRSRGRALLVEAGAGTGKTWVLVERYVGMLADHPDWPIESLVAITFTEKAAREMRNRIRERITALARRDGGIWLERRRALDRMQVSTIHGLCARLLRENALDAVVDPKFAVLDAFDALLLQDEAVDRLVGRLADEDHPALELLAGHSLRIFRQQLSTLLDRRGSAAPLFDDLPSPEALFEQWRVALDEAAAQFWTAARRSDPRLEQVEALAGLEAAPEDRLTPSVLHAQQGLAAAESGQLPTAAAAWLQINLVGGRQAAWGGKEPLATLKESLRALRDVAREMTKAGLAAGAGENDREAAHRLHLWREIWLALEAEYQRLKAERYALDFDDLELLTVRMLQQEPRGARLQATLDAYHHVMVDEFQDTNAAQRTIVYGLAPPDAAGKLFIVGDAKQSIYRFRQAQVSVFSSTRDEIEAATGAPPIALDRSFRSRPALIAALNEGFDRLFAPLGERHLSFEAQPGALSAHRDPIEIGPPVEITLLPARDEQGERLSADEARRWEAARIAARLRALRDEGYPVGDGRPFDFGDGALLLRASSSFPIYEEALKRAGIPYLTVGGRGYYDRSEIQDLIGLLRALDNPNDDLSLAVALRSPLFALSDETLFRLRWQDRAGALRDEAAPLLEALLDPPPCPDEAWLVAHAATLMTDLGALAGRLTIWELLRAVLDRTGFEATLARLDLDGGRRRPNVLKFLDLARGQGGVSLSLFLAHVDMLQGREAREGEALAGEAPSDALQLMTIHGAKGLEFPVVAVADLGRSGPSITPAPLHLDPLYGITCDWQGADGEWVRPASAEWARWMEKRLDAAEERRILYVACTRAADLLLLSGRPTSKGQDGLGLLLGAWDLEIPPPGPPHVVARDGYEISLQTLASEPVLPPGRPGSAAPAPPVRPPNLDPLPIPPLPPRSPVAGGLDPGESLRERLAGSEVGRLIESADLCCEELPFSGTDADGAYHGTIDLLLRHGTRWRLIMLAGGPVEGPALAVAAARAVLDVEPECLLLSLAPTPRLRPAPVLDRGSPGE